MTPILAPLALMIVSMALIPLGDTAGKLLIEDHGFSPAAVGWLRFVTGLVVALPLLWIHRAQLSTLLDWRVYLRGALIAMAILSILTALKTEDIGSVYGAFFVGPLISYALSVLLLRERVTPMRTMLLLIGFGGVILVVKPGFGMTAGLGFAVLAGLLYGCFLTATRWLSGDVPAGLTLVAQLAVGSTLLLPPAALDWPGIDTWPMGLLMVSGVGSVAGNLLLLLAYRLMPGTALAPLIYFQLIAAAAYGYIVWGALPDALALAGLGLLLGSGLGSLALKRAA